MKNDMSDTLKGKKMECENKAKGHSKRELELSCENNMLKIRLNLAYAEMQKLHNEKLIAYDECHKVKKLLELAIKDIQTCMTNDCDVCAFDFQTCKNNCKWRYLDDALNLIDKQENK